MFATLAAAILCIGLVVAQEKPEAKKPSGAAKQGKAAEKKPAVPAMPMAPKPAPEIQKVIKLFAGTWDVAEKIDPSEFMPQGGTSTGSDVARAGPGGHSLVRDFRSKGAMGSFSGHGIIYWDAKNKVYQYVWCDSMSAEGCEVGSTGKWEGDNLIFASQGEYLGKKYQMKLGYTDIKPDSYTFYIDQSIDGRPMKRVITSTFTRKASSKAAAPAKQ
jgi:hypothetical protein